MPSPSVTAWIAAGKTMIALYCVALGCGHDATLKLAYLPLALNPQSAGQRHRVCATFASCKHDVKWNADRRAARTKRRPPPAEAAAEETPMTEAERAHQQNRDRMLIEMAEAVERMLELTRLAYPAEAMISRGVAHQQGRLREARDRFAGSLAKQ